MKVFTHPLSPRRLSKAVLSGVMALTTLAGCDELLSTLNGTISGDEFTQCMGINNAADIIGGALDASQDSVNCPKFKTQYDTAVANEGKLTNTINPSGDYSMALTLNGDGIQKLFDAATDWSDTFRPIIGIGGCRTKKSDGSYYDDIFGSDLDVDNCLTFGFQVNVSGVFSGKAVFGVPITDKIDANQTKTSIFADLSKAQIIQLCQGTSCTVGAANALIEKGIKIVLSDYLKRVHLFDIAAWQIGNNDIKLLAGAPRVQADQATGYKVVEFGMYSNLFFSETSTINLARDMPQDAEVGLHIHPELIRAIIARMMTETKGASNETYITRDVELATSSTSSSSGGFHVTMADLSRYPNERLYACSSDWRDYFTFGFRLWSTDSFCGYMDLLAGMKFEITDSKFEIGLGNIHGGYSDGAMSIVSGALNSITSTDFFKELLNYTNISVNFNEMSVSRAGSGQPEKTQMGADHFQLDIDGSGINLYLNFLDI